MNTKRPGVINWAGATTSRTVGTSDTVPIGSRASKTVSRKVVSVNRAPAKHPPVAMPIHTSKQTQDQFRKQPPPRKLIVRRRAARARKRFCVIRSWDQHQRRRYCACTSSTCMPSVYRISTRHSSNSVGDTDPIPASTWRADRAPARRAREKTFLYCEPGPRRNHPSLHLA